MTSFCPAFKDTGECFNSGCTLSHDLYSCDACKLGFPSQTLLNGHFTSKSHKTRAKAASTGGHIWGYCDICSLHVPIADWDIHVRGKKHRRSAASSGILPQNVQPQRPRGTGDEVLCDLCEVLFPAKDLAMHNAGAQHRKRQSFVHLKSVLKDAAMDRHGVSLSHEDGVNFGRIEATASAGGFSLDVSVMAPPEARVRISEVNIVGLRASAGSFSAQSTSDTLPSLIRVTLTQSLLGEYAGRMEVVFNDLERNAQFMIVRTLTATVIGNRGAHDLLQPSAPYVQKSRAARREPQTDVIPGEPLSVSPLLARKAAKLGKYAIPKDLAAILDSGKVSDAISQIQASMIPGTVDGESYGTFWKILVWAEEHRAELDLQMFDIEDAVLQKHGGVLYWLRVPGLAEKRPSVLKDDRIHVRPRGSTGAWYEGRVHEIHELEAGLKFNKSFPTPSPGQQYSVRFKLNRIPVRRQHQALEPRMYHADRVLFPANLYWPGHPAQAVGQAEIAAQLYNEDIGSNARQLTAVTRIANMSEGNPPFILFGPPGTGKTVTVVEGALQFLRLFPDARLFITAPSNSAADLLAQRLSAVLGEKELFRLYGRSRQVREVPADLHRYALIVGNSIDVPPADVLANYRVVVSTCVSAALPYQLGLERGHFRAIFVDEAAQATEPEVMIAIKTMANDKTNVVLAGDPKQLGPVIRSAVARELGLGRSYLERLMESPGEMYTPHGDQERSVVKLVNNYRSHPAILTFPNNRFYAGELVTSAPDEKRNACIGASLLVNKKYPVVFHAISGKNEREATSPSYFNILEAEQIKLYIDELMADQSVSVRYEEIGVIAPYHAQVVKIRKLLRETGNEGIRDVDVGSVEQFQGQERKVIFVSTVRSSRELVDYDLRHTLGFVSNERRFNVAVTRAQSLLVIVGDPNVLSLDAMWRSFLNVVHENDGWRGQPIPWDPQAEVREDGGYDAEARAEGVAELNDLTERLRAMDVGDEEEAAEDRGPFRESD